MATEQFRGDPEPRSCEVHPSQVRIDGATSAPLLARGTRWRFTGLRAGVLELLFLTALYVTYTASRLLASNDLGTAKARAIQLLDIERPVGLDFELSLNTFFVEHDLIGLAGSFWYASAHYIVTLVVLVWLYLQGRDKYLPARRALIVGTLLALALYLLLPTAPPRFFPEAYTDVLVLHSDVGWWGGEASAPKGMGHLTNQLAAFPSLHCGWSLWVALVLHRYASSTPLKIAAWVGAAVTAVVVVGTGNHWTLDVIVGWIVILAGVVGVFAFSTRSTLMRTAPAADDGWTTPVG